VTIEDPTTSSASGSGARRFVLFVASGGCAEAVNWLSRFPLAHFMSFPAAVAVAYLIGMVVRLRALQSVCLPRLAETVHRPIALLLARQSRRHCTGLGSVDGAYLLCLSRHWLLRRVGPGDWPRNCGRCANDPKLFRAQASYIRALTAPNCRRYVMFCIMSFIDVECIDAPHG
jgi:hypothetical protein